MASTESLIGNTIIISGFAKSTGALVTPSPNSTKICIGSLRVTFGGNPGSGQYGRAEVFIGASDDIEAKKIIDTQIVSGSAYTVFNSSDQKIVFPHSDGLYAKITGTLGANAITITFNGIADPESYPV